MQRLLKICFALSAAGVCSVTFAANLHDLREAGSPNPTARTVDTADSPLPSNTQMGKSL